MRVLLVLPTFKYAFSYPEFLSMSDFPTGFAYIAASLKQAGHEVVGLNANNIVGYVNAQAMLQAVLSEKVKAVSPGLIGLGGLATDYAFLRDAIAICRKEVPSVPIVLGGQVVTNDAKDIFSLLQPDFAIVGEAEESVVQLADTIQSGEKNYEAIDNLWYWREG